MFKRLKRGLVESYVGAIALGYLLAQGLMHFTFMFSAPVSGWIMRDEYRMVAGLANWSAGFWLRLAWPEAIKSLGLLLIWYVLLRWLYYKPLEDKTLGSTESAD